MLKVVLMRREGNDFETINKSNIGMNLLTTPEASIEEKSESRQNFTKLANSLSPMLPPTEMKASIYLDDSLSHHYSNLMSNHTNRRHTKRGGGFGMTGTIPGPFVTDRPSISLSPPPKPTE